MGIPVALADCLRSPSDQSREAQACETVIRVTYSPTLGLRYPRQGIPSGSTRSGSCCHRKTRPCKSPPDEQPWKRLVRKKEKKSWGASPGQVPHPLACFCHALAYHRQTCSLHKPMHIARTAIPRQVSKQVPLHVFMYPRIWLACSKCCKAHHPDWPDSSVGALRIYQRRHPPQPIPITGFILPKTVLTIRYSLTQLWHILANIRT